MDSILNLIVQADNVRMLVILAFVCSGYVRINSKMDRKIDRLEVSLNKRMDGLETSIKELKYNDFAAIHRRIDDLKNNDFAHLNGTIEALTYALEKNGALKLEDKAYVDSRLATV